MPWALCQHSLPACYRELCTNRRAFHPSTSAGPEGCNHLFNIQPLPACGIKYMAPESWQKLAFLPCFFFNGRTTPPKRKGCPASEHYGSDCPHCPPQVPQAPLPAQRVFHRPLWGSCPHSISLTPLS